ncbi:Myocardin-related transcription factor B [Labeo rohita]|uniref:Myocardin-related transcription factor B n=1 Tax=Labeo rohita TaxID=84645 RepID=A0ABQ8M7C1_LABRO|nr:Myocardin-related transcription factor B [Labeo rohita]
MESPEERGPCAFFTKFWCSQVPTLGYSEREAGRVDSMACLGLETHNICRGNFIPGSAACCSTLRVLQLRLQQRRTREQLVDQGIMPRIDSARIKRKLSGPEGHRVVCVLISVWAYHQHLERLQEMKEPSLKSPAAFHEQIRSLERARTENFLKHKIRSRPERAELVRMHILQETVAEPSLQATQLKLKRARLADDLNEKIAQRPGPMELVEKNILPVDSSVKEAIIDGQMQYPRTLEELADEDSGDAFSPEQPASQESQGSAPSPGEVRAIEESSPLPNNLLQHFTTVTTSTDFLKPFSTNEQSFSPPAPMPQLVTVAPVKTGPTLVKQSQPKFPGDKSRSKKSKEAKPRVKKLKYHQYIPPDQKQEPSQAPMDSSYARLLQQQQLFLQLQILSQQQQQHYNYQTILPAPLKPVIEGQNSSATVAINSTSSLPASIVVSLPTATPVAELKMELKLRGLPVSGTKTDLIERLKPFQENNASTAHNNSTGPSTQPCSTPMEVSNTTTTLSPVQQPSEILSSTPPVSPGSLELHSKEDTSMEAQAEGQNRSLVKAAPVPEEQDRRLHEKERQIEELLRKLEQEQKLVEELKMQLEVEKRSGQVVPPAENNISSPATMLAPVKTENTVPPNCKLSSHTTPTLVKLEEAHPNQVTATSLRQFIISHQGLPQVIGQPQTLLTTSHGGTQILLPVPLANNTTTIQLPNTNVKLQTLSVGTTERSSFQHGTIENPAGLEIPQCFLSSSPDNRISPQTSPVPSSLINGPLNKTSFIQQSPVFNQTPKSREPPRYEEAVKQTRSLQNVAVSEIPTATSQQMDDLFDILIESGEITPFSQQDPSVPKMMPVTASITTLPVNTALSRPPAQVQMAPPPALMAEPMPSLASLDSDNQLEALLEGTLVGDTEPEQRTLGLLEELQNQILEQPNSPMDTSELGFNDPPATSSSALSFSLQDTGLDNMEWLDLTMPGPIGGLNPLGITSEFLDTHDLQLHWD